MMTSPAVLLLGAALLLASYSSANPKSIEHKVETTKESDDPHDWCGFSHGDGESAHHGCRNFHGHGDRGDDDEGRDDDDRNCCCHGMGHHGSNWCCKQADCGCRGDDDDDDHMSPFQKMVSHDSQCCDRSKTPEKKNN